MTNVVSMADHKQSLWSLYVAARDRAERTGDINDGIAAGRAWSRWLDMFMTEEQREFLDRASA